MISSRFVRAGLLGMSLSLALAAMTPARAQLPQRYALEPGALADYNAGAAAMNKQDFQSAADHFSKVLAADPNFAAAHANLGACQAQMGKLDEAKTELLKAIEIDPNFDTAWLNLGSTLQSMGDTKGALDAYHKFMSIQHNNPLAGKVQAIIIGLETEQKRTASQPPEDPNADNYLQEAIQSGFARWPKSRMPITVHITPTPSLPGYRPEFAQILKKSFEEWEKASGGVVSFKFVDRPLTDGFECTWTDNPRKMISSAEGGHTETVSDQQGLIKAEMTLLTQGMANRPTLTPNYARIIDLHEIGHGLGILGHSRRPGDILFSTIPPSDVNDHLSARDAKTIIALYKLDPSKVTNNPIDATRAAISGDPNSIPVRVIRLNGEGQKALMATNIPLAIQKFQEALKLDPDNDVAKSNLGACYVNAASLASMMHRWDQVDRYFQMAIPLLERSPDPTALPRVLTSYVSVLKMQGKNAQAAPYEARLKALQSH